jgi:hypothetical protein
MDSSPQPPLFERAMKSNEEVYNLNLKTTAYDEIILENLSKCWDDLKEFIRVREIPFFDEDLQS